MNDRLSLDHWFKVQPLEVTRDADLWFDEGNRQLHVLDVGAVDGQLDHHTVKHVEHNIACCLGTLLYTHTHHTHTHTHTYTHTHTHAHTHTHTHTHTPNTISHHITTRSNTWNTTSPALWVLSSTHPTMSKISS